MHLFYQGIMIQSFFNVFSILFFVSKICAQIRLNIQQCSTEYCEEELEYGLVPSVLAKPFFFFFNLSWKACVGPPILVFTV